MGFCDAIHPTLISLNSDRIVFMNDFSLSGEMSVVADDLETLVHSAKENSLFCNTSKCKIIANNFLTLSTTQTLSRTL